MGCGNLMWDGVKDSAVWGVGCGVVWGCGMGWGMMWETGCDVTWNMVWCVLVGYLVRGIVVWSVV